MNEKKTTAKEIVFRQWFASKYGHTFVNHNEYELPDTIANLDRAYQRDLGVKMPVSFNFSMDKLRIIRDEIKISGTFDLFLDQLNAGLDIPTFPMECRQMQLGEDIRAAQVDGDARITEPFGKEVTLDIRSIDDIDFPSFKLYGTGGAIDRLMSDFTDDGGLYGGTVTVVTGESGVGKSTLLIDLLAKMKDNHDRKTLAEIEKAAESRKLTGELRERFVSFHMKRMEFRPLYISSEMTRNDVYFFKKKMPQICCLPVMFVSDYLKGGLKEAIMKVFDMRSDVILLDSYQDLVEKLKDINGWKGTFAENFLINLMVEAAEKRGVAILAIQHLTKNGQYVGRTFLKHTTTAMMHLCFDENKKRFIMFSKNRRGGSMMHVPLYFSMEKSTGSIVYDEAALDSMLRSMEISEKDVTDKKELNGRFNSLFGSIVDMVEKQRQAIEEETE